MSGGRRGGNNIDVYVSSYTSYFMFCVYCPARTVLHLSPLYGKKMGIQCVIPFSFVPQDPLFAAHFFSLIRFLPGATKVPCAAPCLPFIHSHIFHFLSPLSPHFTSPTSPFLFPICFSHFSSLVSFTPIQKSREKQDKCFAFWRCLRPRVSL